MDPHQTLVDRKLFLDFPPLPVKVYVNGQPVYSMELEDTLEFGRQDLNTKPPEPPPWMRLGSGDRVVIAREDQNTISRRHLRLSRLSKNDVQIENLSAVNPVTVDKESIPPPDFMRSNFA